MYTDIPTTSDVIGMIILLIVFIAVLVKLQSTCNSVEDVDAWSRNYDKIQRRHSKRF